MAKDHRAASEMEKVNRYYIPKEDVVSLYLSIALYIIFCGLLDFNLCVCAAVQLSKVIFGYEQFYAKRINSHFEV